MSGVTVAKLSVNQALLKAKSYVKKGKMQEAQKLYQIVLQAFPKNKQAQQGLDALNKSKQSVATRRLPQETVNQLLNLYNQGQLVATVERANTLTEQYPEAFVVWNILGAAHKGLGKFYEASIAFTKVTELNSSYPDGFNNLGAVLQEQGEIDRAVQAYNKAISLDPFDAEAQYNLGNALQEQGKFKGAIKAYNKALSLKPNNAEAYLGLGNTLQKLSDPDKAIEAYDQALLIQPNYPEAYYNMVAALKGRSFRQSNPRMQYLLTSILEQKGLVRPRDISSNIISLLKHEPTIKKLFHQDFASNIKQSFEELVKALPRVPLLLKFMSVCPIDDLGLEKALTKIRSHILIDLSKICITSQVLHFQSALALQCFSNEYIYNQDNLDIEELAKLERSIAKTFAAGKQPNTQSLLCLASFKALNEYSWCESIASNRNLKEVICRQVSEPHEEKKIRKNIPSFRKITDTTSSHVRDQYEENPYPRWVDLELRPKPATIFQLATEKKLRFVNNAIKNVTAPNILIAGCGTGQHSIGAASNFQNAQILAVDLSLSSLAYAKRKTRELGIENIDYIQADILDLNKLDKQFDIIESVGVLHHMGDPMAGWRALTDCLKQGGVMKVGLYSELARRPIIEIRNFLSQSGIPSSIVEMRAFRKKIINSDRMSREIAENWSDFYSLSELRDLLFHVQEHRFTIPQIKNCLKELGLEFCGFERGNVVDNFEHHYNAKDALYNLDKWQAYENAHHRAFLSMYQFWCQKIT